MAAPGTLSERDFQRNVIDLARMLGWRVAHFRPARHSKGWSTPIQGDPGFPDLVLAKGGRVVFAELKSQKGKVADEQAAWLQALSGVGDWREFDAVDRHLLDDHGMSRGITDGYARFGDAFRVCVWRPSDLEDIKGILNVR